MLARDVEVVELKARSHWSVFPKAMRALWRIRPDVVLSTHSHLNLIIMTGRWLMPWKTRFVGRESTLPSVHYSVTRSKYRWLVRLLLRRAYNRFDAIICQSLAMRRDLVESFRVQSGCITVINNPVDVDCVLAKAEQATDLMPGRARLVAAGRMDHGKGFDLLLQALALMKRPDTNLMILGEGPERERLAALAQELGLADRVSMPGFVENPYPAIRQASVFVLSSRYEGFPNVVLEAGACGTPVAAFDCPGGTGEIIKPGVNGFLAEPEDPESLARAMAQVLDGSLDRERIRAMTRERYGVETIINQYEALLGSI